MVQEQPVRRRGQCVEAAFLENDRVGMRDSKNPSGPALMFTGTEWDRFLAGVKNGEFDR